MPNKVLNSLASLVGTPGTPRRFAHGFAMIAQMPLRTRGPLARRYVQKGR